MRVKKIIASILTVVCAFQPAVMLAAEVDAGYSSISSTMSIKGEAGKYNAGEDITLLLLDKNADINDYTYNQIGYIAQDKISDNGTYDFNFKFKEETDNYKLLMNLGGENVTDTVKKATAVKDFYAVEFDINKDDIASTAEVVVTIENRYKISSQGCKLIMAFYDADGKMLGVKSGEAMTILQDSVTNDSVSDAMPVGTEKVKAMLWDSTEKMIPLCTAEERDDKNRTIVCWGDSLTEGAGGYQGLDGETVDWVTYPKVLAELTGNNVINRGVGGQSATQIAVRQGGITLNTTKEFTIPAEIVPVEVEITTSNGISIINNPYDMGLKECSINDIAGKLECIDDKFYFTRTEIGKKYNVPVGTQIVAAESLEYNDSIAVIFVGANGGWTKQDSDYHTYNAYIEIVDSMIEHLDYENPQYIVVGLTIGDDEGYDRMDTILNEKYGNRYVPLRHYLTDDETIYTKKGITLSDSDKENMALGKVPGCIKVDGIHHNSVGYTIIGELLYNHMKNIGMLD